MAKSIVKRADTVGRWFYVNTRDNSGDKLFCRKRQTADGDVAFDVVTYDGEPVGGVLPVSACCKMFKAWRPRAGKIMFAVPGKQKLADSRFELAIK
jgi:hypothetical protein